MLATRPTAINLRWALERMKRAMLLPLRERGSALAAASRGGRAICDEDVAISQAIGAPRPGAHRRQLGGAKHGGRLNVLTHCNAGWLATVDWGTALAPIYMAARLRASRSMSGWTRPARATRAPA